MMVESKDDKDALENTRQKIIHEQGWYIPSLHEKYLGKKSPKP